MTRGDLAGRGDNRAAHGLSLAMLSWKSRRTLRATLESMRRADLFPLFDDSVVYFQEMDGEDRALAAEFGMRAEGNGKNTGILHGMKSAAQAARGDYVLYVENDVRIADDMDGKTAAARIAESLSHLAAGRVHCCRMERGTVKEANRHLRYFPSDGSRDTAGRILRRLLRPARTRRLIGGAIFTNDSPEALFPKHIRRLGANFLAVDSSCLGWSNRAVLYPRRWFLDEILPFAESHPADYTVNGFPDLEGELNDGGWWGRQHYQMGFGGGVFQHERLDRPDNDEKARRE